MSVNVADDGVIITAPILGGLITKRGHTFPLDITVCDDTKLLVRIPIDTAVDFRGAVLRKADFTRFRMQSVNFRNCYMESACFNAAHITEGCFIGVDATQANFNKTYFNFCNFAEASLSQAQFCYAILHCVNFSNANLAGANFSYATLNNVNFSGADLSGAIGLADPIKFIEGFECDDKGVIVYKAIGSTEYKRPDRWEIKAGAFLEEEVNPDRSCACGCGVNFGTLDYCAINYRYKCTIWKCRIRWKDLVGVVVPYRTEGKARCRRLELIEPAYNTSD